MKSKTLLPLALLAAIQLSYAQEKPQLDEPVTYGVRPFFLVDQLPDGELKQTLENCKHHQAKRTDFTIGHRGAALQFPEHTRDSYLAAAREGAGIIECDVAFTKDKELVCRHAQNDLASTTNILLTPLAEKCSVPFTPAEIDKDGNVIKPANAECRTSDITLEEFKSLVGKMDGFNPNALTVEEFVEGTPKFRTDLYTQNGQLMTHKESIELFKQLGVKMTPELKDPVVDMPFDGMTLEQYAQKMLDEYKEAGVDPALVFPQTFNPDVMKYWLKNAPEFAPQVVFLDEELETQKRIQEMPELKALGLKYIAPAMPMLVKNDGGKIGVSDYAKAAKENDLKIITWTLERSGLLKEGGGWYYTGINDITHNDGMTYQYLDVLAKDIGIVGIFSDWPATVTYYANCKGL